MLNVHGYIREVARLSRIDLGRLLGADRHKEVVRVRQAIMLVLRVKAKPWLSYKRIGDLFGRDHSTVIYGADQTLYMLRRGDPETLRLYKIAVRCWVQMKQSAQAERRAAAAFIERTSHDRHNHLYGPKPSGRHDLGIWATQRVREAQGRAAAG